MLVSKGVVKIDDVDIEAGDGATIEDIDHVSLHAVSDAECLLIDLAA